MALGSTTLRSIGGPLAAAAATALGSAGSSAVVKGLGGLLADDGRSMGHASPQHVRRAFDTVRKQYGLDVGYVHDPELAGLNAGYSTREGLTPQIEKLVAATTDPDILQYGKPATVSKLKRALGSLLNVGEHGLVITGKHFKKPGTVEHELGHAIATHRGNPVEKAIAKYNVPQRSFLYSTIPSYIAALAGGAKSPGLGALAGGLTGLGTGFPALYSEYSANKYGDELLDPSKPNHGKWKAYGSYAADAGLGPALTGALFGLAKQKLKLKF